MSVRALWDQYQDQFPIRQQFVYLNHAGVSPLCKRAADAMKHFADDALAFGSLHYDQWLAAYQGVRDAAAKLIQATPGEIAIVKNTSEGIAMIAAGMKWNRGEKMVAFQEEFPSNYYPWKRLEAAGVEVRWLSIFDPLEKVEQACRGARMLAVSYVQYLSGYRVDLNALGEICARNQCLFLVDAIQGLGAFALDVRKAKIHALSSDGHKWLMGPEGCGILYVERGFQDQVEPIEFGWTNVAKYNDYSSREMALRPDAGRYECGTLNTIGCYGLRAALEFVNGIGPHHIGEAVQALGDRIWDGVQARGYEVLGRRSPRSGAGIVSFRKAGVESHAIVRHLKTKGFLAAPRQGWVRASPHFYVSPADIDRLLEALEES